MLDIEIDGKALQVEEGSTVIEAAHKAGTYIPHFCYHKKLSIAANCRMCLVQVEKAPKPMPACATSVTNGMKVFTHSDMAIKAQKGVMDFLLINHPLDCPICDQGGECQLQDLAVGYGSSSSRYAEEKRVVPNKDLGALVSTDMTRCINCTRCVRFTQEIAGFMELGQAFRGERAEVMPYIEQTVDSELSGNIIDLCPVGALTSKPFRFAARTWELSRRKSVSPHDGLGSNLIVQTKHDRVLRVLPFENEDINECWLSDKERFSYAGLYSADRLTRPMLKQDGSWREVDWNAALDYVAHALRDVAKNHGADMLGGLLSPHATLEELYLAQKLLRGMGCQNVDFRLRQRDFSVDGHRAGVPWLGMRIAELSKLDRALVIGSFLRKDHPLIAQRLRQIAKRGAHVNVVHAADDDLYINLKHKAIVAPSQMADVLRQVIKAAATARNVAVPDEASGANVGPAAQAIAESMLGGEAKAVLLGNFAEQHADAATLALLAPDGQAAMAALGSAASVVALTSFTSPALLAAADALLPLAPFTETSGTFVNTEGRAQSFHAATKPLGEARPGWKILRVLGNLLDLQGFDFESSEGVRNEALAGRLDADGFLRGLDNRLNASPATTGTAGAAGLERVADIPIHFADPLARRAAPLQATSDAALPVARMNAATAGGLGIAGGQVANYSGGGTAPVALTTEIDAGVPDGCVRIAGAHAATVDLGALTGRIAVRAGAPS